MVRVSRERRGPSGLGGTRYSCCGRERSDCNVWELFLEAPQLHVVRTKVMTPLAHTVGFVNHKPALRCTNKQTG